jgi:hypothetical protein
MLWLRELAIPGLGSISVAQVQEIHAQKVDIERVNKID